MTDVSGIISRRHFLAGAAAATGSAFFMYVGGWWLFKVRKQDSTDFVSAILEKKLSWLKLDEEGVRAFSEDFGYSELAGWAGMFGLVYRYVDIFDLASSSGKLHDFEDIVVLQYLLSTDFFQNDADESGVVKYLGYYDPFRPGFRNPLARF